MWTGTGIVEGCIALMGEGRVVVISTSWAGVHDEKKVALFKLRAFHGVRHDGRWGVF